MNRPKPPRSPFAMALQAWINALPPELRDRDTAEQASAYLIQVAAIIAAEHVRTGEEPDAMLEAAVIALDARLEYALQVMREYQHQEKN